MDNEMLFKALVRQLIEAGCNYSNIIYMIGIGTQVAFREYLENKEKDDEAIQRFKKCVDILNKTIEEVKSNEKSV